MKDFCDEHKFIGLCETSAKNNTNIAETFFFLITEVRRKLKFIFQDFYFLVYRL